MTEKKALLEALNSMSPQMRGALIGGLVGAGGAALFGDRDKLLQNMLMFGGLGAAGGYGLGGYMQNQVGEGYGRGFQAAKMLGGINQAAKDPATRKALGTAASIPMLGASLSNPVLSAISGAYGNTAPAEKQPGFMDQVQALISSYRAAQPIRPQTNTAQPATKPTAAMPPSPSPAVAAPAPKPASQPAAPAPTPVAPAPAAQPTMSNINNASPAAFENEPINNFQPVAGTNAPIRQGPLQRFVNRRRGR